MRSTRDNIVSELVQNHFIEGVMKTKKQEQRHLGFKIKAKSINKDESNAI